MYLYIYIFYSLTSRHPSKWPSRGYIKRKESGDEDAQGTACAQAMRHS